MSDDTKMLPRAVLVALGEEENVDAEPIACRHQLVALQRLGDLQRSIAPLAEVICHQPGNDKIIDAIFELIAGTFDDARQAIAMNRLTRDCAGES